LLHSATLPEVVLECPVGAAHEQFFDRFEFAILRGPVQRRVPAWKTGGTRLPRPPMPKRKSSPIAVRRVDCGFGSNQFSDDSAITMECRNVQHGDSIAVHGGAG
jgi:hypothetical protein